MFSRFCSVNQNKKDISKNKEKSVSFLSWILLKIYQVNQNWSLETHISKNTKVSLNRTEPASQAPRWPPPTPSPALSVLLSARHQRRAARVPFVRASVCGPTQRLIIHVPWRAKPTPKKGILSQETAQNHRLGSQTTVHWPWKYQGTAVPCHLEAKCTIGKTKPNISIWPGLCWMGTVHLTYLRNME